MSLPTFLAAWCVAAGLAAVLLITAVRSIAAGHDAAVRFIAEYDGEPLNLWDDWDAQSERGGW